MAHDGRIVPVLLSGGPGARLWPLSRDLYPKQFLPLTGERSMVQETALRVADATRFAPPMVVCHQEHRFILVEQLRDVGVTPTEVIVEPSGRNTAPAIALAALRALATAPEALLLMLPTDHVVRGQNAFLDAVGSAERAAERGLLTAFGLPPTRAETGFGYIRVGEPVTGGIASIAAFVEKPDSDAAARMATDGRHLWNSGMFLLSARTLVEELKRHRPEILTAARAALAGGTAADGVVTLDADAFMQAPALSIDVAVMERTQRAAVVPAQFEWSDIGTWSALWEHLDKDGDGNVCQGDVLVEDSRNCVVHSEGMLTTVLGVEDLVVVVTEDAVLIAAKDRAQEVRALHDRLAEARRAEASSHRCVYRPWGHYRTLQMGERFQVKCITVRPGGLLSLQKHYHRAEHWVVVNGTALVTRDSEELLLRENESCSIRLGAVHRLHNPGKVPLNLIEVQSGSYLGEDDIVRFEDTYGRS